MNKKNIVGYKKLNYVQINEEAKCKIEIYMNKISTTTRKHFYRENVFSERKQNSVLEMYSLFQYISICDQGEQSSVLLTD